MAGLGGLSSMEAAKPAAEDSLDRRSVIRGEVGNLQQGGPDGPQRARGEDAREFVFVPEVPVEGAV